MSVGRAEQSPAEPLALLDVLWNEPWAWKHRLVYRVTISTVTHARVESHYQFVLPPALLDDAGVEPSGPVRALLPLSWRPKELLLNVAASCSAGSPVHVLTRNEIAQLHADHVVGELAASIPEVAVEEWDRRTSAVEAVARTMPRRARTLTEGRGGLRSAQALAHYLADGLDISVDAATVSGWQERLRAAETALWAAEPWGTPDENVACNFLLAVPELQPLGSVAAVDTAISDYIAVVEAALRVGEGFPGQLSRLGVDWPLIVVTEVEPAVPTTVTFEEDRPLPPADLRNEPLEIPVPTEDAASVHVETRLQDSSALLGDVKVVDVGGDQFPLAEDVRATMDRHAVYLSAPIRPSRGRLRVRVRLAGEVAVANRVVAALAFSALVVSFLVRNEPGVFGLLVVPVSLAVSVIQVRERTSLVRALTGSARAWLVGMALALWVVVVVRLLVQSTHAPGLLTLFS